MLIDKQNMPMVAMEFMNDVHTEDIDIINELFELILKYEDENTNLNKELIDKKYEEWVEHTLAHFEGEEKLMVEKGFPPYPIHKGEHDKVLLHMDDIYKQWQQSEDIQVLKNFISTYLPQWLTQHIQTMDTVTAMFFKTGLSPCTIH